jgi:hypothetical protein
VVIPAGLRVWDNFWGDPCRIKMLWDLLRWSLQD